MARVTPIALILLTLLASRALAQQQEHQDLKSEKLGTVHFATSCNEAAQQEFDRAAALLHSFQFSRAIEGFNAVLAKDATCGIAYWGIALSDWSNPFAQEMKDKSQLQAGRESAERGKAVGAKTERERCVSRGSQQIVRRLPEHAATNTFSRLSRRHGESGGEISGGP